MIAGMIMAVMLVVQPAYAVGKHFNIFVTVSSFSMVLLNDQGDEYEGWPITVPPGEAVTMTAKHAVMVSLTSETADDLGVIDIITSVKNDDGWVAVLPPTPGNDLPDNHFCLEAAAIDGDLPQPGDPIVLTADGFRAITEETAGPTVTIDATGDAEADVWLLYKFHAADHYGDGGQADLEVKIEAIPQ